MKLKNIMFILLLAATSLGHSQLSSKKIGSNPTIAPLSCAVVEVESTTKGFLPPRMFIAQAMAIVLPATGLTVWCIDCGPKGELLVFNGKIWTTILGNTYSAPSTRVPTVGGGTLVFMQHNLGADTSADPLTPSWKLNGAYFQWGKKPLDTNGDLYLTKTNDGPNGFAAGPTGPDYTQANDGIVPSWSTTSAANGAWNVTAASPIKTVNDPCPAGFRVPTSNEWTSIYGNTKTRANWLDINGSTWKVSAPNDYLSGKIVANTLYLPASGNRQTSGSGILQNYGFGVYWSSTESGTTGVNSLLFSSSTINTASFWTRIYGLSVRCVAE